MQQNSKAMQKFLSKGRYFLLLLLAFYGLLNFLVWQQVIRQVRADEEETIKAAIQHNNNLVVSLEQAAIRTIRDADAALSLAKLEFEKEGSVNFTELLNRGLLDVKLFDGLVIIDSAGNLHDAYPNQLKMPRLNLADRGYFQIHKQAGDTLYISKPLWARTIHKSVIVVSRKLTTKNKTFNGVVAIHIQPSAFISFYRQASINKSDILSLIHPGGITYARRTGGLETCGENINKSPLFSHVKKKAVGSYRAKDAIKGVPTFFSYRKLEGYPVIATVGRSEADVLAQFVVRREREMIFGAIITLLLFVFFLSVYLFYLHKRKSWRKIRLSEARYRSVFESSRDAILLLNPNGEVEAMNEAAKAMFKTDIEKNRRLPFSSLFKKLVPDHSFDFNSLDPSACEYKEYEFVCGNNTFIGELAHSSFDDHHEQKNTLILIRDVTHRKLLEKRHLHEQKRYQRNLTKQIIIAQEREREGIGHELHDNVNQILTTVKLYLEIALKGGGEREELIERSIAHVMQCINEIRCLSHSLSAPTLGTKSLVDSFNALIENVSKSARLAITADFTAYNQTINKEQSLALYRIAQEQLNNIVKHANATSVELALVQKNGETILTITDNGQGFDVNAQRKGVGLNNIASRIKAFQGQYFIDSKIGKGCKLVVSLPCAEKTKVLLPEKGPEVAAT